jgi:ketosteroid isomerase-like protein
VVTPNRNLDTVSGIYASFGRGDVPAILERLHADVEWEHDAVDHGVPWLRPGRGREAVAGFFQMLGGLDFATFEPQSFLQGDDLVAAVIRVDLRVRETGARIRDLEIHLWTFDNDGLVTRFRHIIDTHQHVLAVRGAAGPPDAAG